MVVSEDVEIQRRGLVPILYSQDGEGQNDDNVSNFSRSFVNNSLRVQHSLPLFITGGHAVYPKSKTIGGYIFLMVVKFLAAALNKMFEGQIRMHTGKK